jgi:hypothetical protein
MKYGPTQINAIPHGYGFPGASINGNTVILTIADGEAGDDDMVANGSIVDPGGVAVASGWRHRHPNNIAMGAVTHGAVTCRSCRTERKTDKIGQTLARPSSMNNLR